MGRNMNRTFSVITIAKNALPELKRTFESLKNQTVKDFEWIVIDGASNDGTREWLNSLEVKDFKFSWESKKDKGISDAWNKGIFKSKGKQILILNAGDTYDLNMIEIFQEKISENKITCANARLIDLKSGAAVGIFKAEPGKLWRGMHLPHNWCSVPINLYRVHGGYPLLKYAMDFSWFHQFYKSNGNVRFECINLTLGSYYLGGISDKNFIKSFSVNKQILIENGCNKTIASIIYFFYIFKHALKKIRHYI